MASLAAIANEEVAGKAARELSDAEEQSVLAREVSKRKDSAEAYTSGNRPELAEKELAEAAILAEYLPRQLTEAEIGAIYNGKVVKTFKVRLGGYNQHAKTHIWRNFPTANGTWKVYDKQVDPASENYGSGAMPYSTMFYPDMYVHYSPGFHAVGYAGSSHGCVNIGKLSDAIWIFKNTPIGAKVHIYSTKASA